MNVRPKTRLLLSRPSSSVGVTSPLFARASPPLRAASGRGSGRIADRLLIIVQRHAEEKDVEAPEAVDAAERLWHLLFRFSGEDDNPPENNAMPLRDEAAAIGRELVDDAVASRLTSDRLGQLVRNLFECLELGEEGSEISVLAGENPNSLQRPY